MSLCESVVHFFLSVNSIPYGCTFKIGIHLVTNPSTWFMMELRAERDLSGASGDLLANSPEKTHWKILFSLGEPKPTKHDGYAYGLCSYNFGDNFDDRRVAGTEVDTKLKFPWYQGLIC